MWQCPQRNVCHTIMYWAWSVDLTNSDASRVFLTVTIQHKILDDTNMQQLVCSIKNLPFSGCRPSVAFVRHLQKLLKTRKQIAIDFFVVLYLKLFRAQVNESVLAASDEIQFSPSVKFKFFLQSVGLDQPSHTCGAW